MVGGEKVDGFEAGLLSSRTSACNLGRSFGSLQKNSGVVSQMSLRKPQIPPPPAPSTSRPPPPPRPPFLQNTVSCKAVSCSRRSTCKVFFQQATEPKTGVGVWKGGRCTDRLISLSLGYKSNS